MTEDLERTELQRARWRRAREPLGLVNPESAESFGTGGLARHVDDVGVRLLILPYDPSASVVEFDADFWEWWMKNRLNPFEGATPTDWGTQSTPTVEAAVRFHQWDGRWNWGAYLALHRSGALEGGLGQRGFRAWPNREGEREHRGFYLCTIVGRLWVMLHLYQDVLARYSEVRGPSEISLALLRTTDGLLGNVAAGWKDFDGWFPGEAPTCSEPNLLLSRGVTKWLNPDGIRGLAFDLGSQIEDAWGIRDRRFLINQGHTGAGTFDVSRYS